MDTKKVYLLILLFFAFGMILGYFAGKPSVEVDSAKIEGLQKENARISAQISSLKERFPPSPAMRVVLGKVIKVEADSLTISMQQILINPFEDIPKTRKVLINSDTKVVALQKATQQEFLSEIEKYKESVAQNLASNDFIPPPVPFKEVPINLNDISLGKNVVIEAGKDVKTLPEFTAARIILEKS